MAKQQKTPVPAGQSTETQPTYQVVGLQPADRMPISFGGRVYDLASLTDEEADYLLQYPEQVPYLQKISQQSQSNG